MECWYGEDFWEIAASVRLCVDDCLYEAKAERCDFPLLPFLMDDLIHLGFGLGIGLGATWQTFHELTSVYEGCAMALEYD